MIRHHCDEITDLQMRLTFAQISKTRRQGTKLYIDRVWTNVKDTVNLPHIPQDL